LAGFTACQYRNAKAFHNWKGQNMLERIDTERGLYVLNNSGWLSCLGFEYAQARIEQVQKWLGGRCRFHMRPEHTPGTAGHYNSYEVLMNLGREHHKATGQRCEADLHPHLKGLEGKRIEVEKPQFDSDPKRFIVGKSCGWMPVHLVVKTRRSHGGDPINRGHDFGRITVLGK
jgi:hypothetical protein